MLLMTYLFDLSFWFKPFEGNTYHSNLTFPSQLVKNQKYNLEKVVKLKIFRKLAITTLQTHETLC